MRTKKTEEGKDDVGGAAIGKGVPTGGDVAVLSGESEKPRGEGGCHRKDENRGGGCLAEKAQDAEREEVTEEVSGPPVGGGRAGGGLETKEGAEEVGGLWRRAGVEEAQCAEAGQEGECSCDEEDVSGHGDGGQGG